MTYKLTITRKEKNPDYVAPRGYNGIMEQRYDVSEYSTFDVLDVEVSPEQFEAIRKAVLEKF